MMDQSLRFRAPLISPPWIFFFWLFVKARVYEIPVPDLVTLRGRIVAVVQTVDVAML